MLGALLALQSARCPPRIWIRQHKLVERLMSLASDRDEHRKHVAISIVADHHGAPSRDSIFGVSVRATDVLGACDIECEPATNGLVAVVVTSQQHEPWMNFASLSKASAAGLHVQLTYQRNHQLQGAHSGAGKMYAFVWSA
jgi:hypothetical protein